MANELVNRSPQQLEPTRNTADRFMDALFRNWPLGYRAEHLVPAMDVYANSEKIVVTLDLPGAKKEDVSIQATSDTLTVSGYINGESDGEALMQERFVGRFSRQVRLPCHVDPNQVKARFENGVLTIALAKTDAARARTITVDD